MGIVNADGTDLRYGPGTSGESGDASFSPDGSYVAFDGSVADPPSASAIDPASM